MLIEVFARAEDCKLHPAFPELRQKFSDEVRTLLCCQTADHREQRNIRIFFQTQLFLKSQFVLHLLSDAFRAVIYRQGLVCLRVKVPAVYAVQDAAQLIAPGLEQSFQTLSVRYRTDLPGVSRADCRDRVRVYNRTLKEVDRVIMDHLSFSRCVVKSAYIAAHISAVLALELQIVDRENRLYRVIQRIAVV